MLCSCVIGTHLTGQTLLQLFSFRASVVIHCSPSASAFPPCMTTYCVSNQLRGDCVAAPRKVAHTCIVDWRQRVLHSLRQSRQAWAQHVRWVLRAELPGRGAGEDVGCDQDADHVRVVRDPIRIHIILILNVVLQAISMPPSHTHARSRMAKHTQRKFRVLGGQHARPLAVPLSAEVSIQ